MKDPTVPAFVSAFVTLALVVGVMAAIIGAVTVVTRQHWQEMADDPYEGEEDDVR